MTDENLAKLLNHRVLDVESPSPILSYLNEVTSIILQDKKGGGSRVLNMAVTKKCSSLLRAGLV